MVERIPVYRYVVEREGQDPELHWSFAPLPSTREEGSPDARLFGTKLAEAESPDPIGHIEAPDGTLVVWVESPVLETPGHGRITLEVAIGASSGTSDLRRILRWQLVAPTSLSQESSP